MKGEKTGPQERTIPDEEWSETLSRFEMSHKGTRVSVQIEEPGGRRVQLEAEVESELRLMGIDKSGPRGPGWVSLTLQRHPGGTVETVEIEEPIAIRRQDGSVLIETAQGRRVLLQSSPA
jgi:hypothetical protein